MAEDVHGRGCAWQGGMYGREAFMAGRACVAGGMRGRGGGACMEGWTCVAGETAIVAGDTHPTGMHSCSVENQTNKKVAVFQNSKSGVYARLWERIQENKEESLCRSTNDDPCSDKWLRGDHLVHIGIAYYFRIGK